MEGIEFKEFAENEEVEPPTVNVSANLEQAEDFVRAWMEYTQGDVEFHLVPYSNPEKGGSVVGTFEELSEIFPSIQKQGGDAVIVRAYRKSQEKE